MKALALAAVSFLFLASCGNNTVAAAPGDGPVAAPAAQKEGGCCSEGGGDACCADKAATETKVEKKGCCGACAPKVAPKEDTKQ
jgi:hypothetical protein